jgi:hypothetical protein
VNTLYVWRGFPQHLLDEMPVEFRQRVRQVSRDNVPLNLVMLVHVDQLDQLHDEGMDSRRLGEYLELSPVIVYRTPGTRYPHRCHRLLKWIHAEVDHGQWDGLREVLCLQQLSTQWDELVFTSGPPIRREEDQKVTFEDFPNLPIMIKQHLRECPTCRTRFDEGYNRILKLALVGDLISSITTLDLGDIISQIIEKDPEDISAKYDA